MSDSTGAKLMWSFLLTLLVVGIASAWVLWRYAAAVQAGMRDRQGLELPLADVAARPASGIGEPWSAAQGIDGYTARSAWQRMVRRRVSLAWLLAAGLPATALAVANAVTTVADRADLPLAILMLATAYAAAAIPPLALSLGWDWRQGFLALFALSTVGLLVVFLTAEALRALGGRAPRWDLGATAWQYAVFLAAILGMPLIALLACGAARVRGVVPIVFGGVVVLAALPALAVNLWLALGDTTVGTELLLGHSWLVHGGRYALHALLALPLALLVWWRLNAIATGYVAKRASDVQLLARAWWFMLVAMVAAEALSVRQDRWGWALVCLTVAGLAAPAQALAFRLLRVVRGAPPMRTLLLLRVFGFRSRTERLFDRVGTRWRYHGPVTMIAAPDVVARTIDPADFLDWLFGRVDSTFVRGAEELERRLAAIDDERDPDGRFRVTEFGCTDNTWRAAVVELMQRADVVLMDLRGITPERAGCAFELEQLAARVLPQRVVLVVAPNADRGALVARLGTAAARVVWFELPDRRSAPTKALFETLLRAAEASSAVVAPMAPPAT